MIVRPGLALAILVLLPGAAAAGILPSPARLGDFSLGLGPVLVLEPGGTAAGGIGGEANLLYSSYSLGLHGHLAVDGGVQPAIGVEASVLGLIGAGVGWQRGGLSIDGLLQVPLPILPAPFFLGLSYRPSFLLQGGVSHEISLQLKWSTLLLPES